MWHNYLTVGWRSFIKNRTYAFINVFGLAIGMAASLLILTYVRYEFSYDTWLPEADRAYQLQNFRYATGQGGEEAKLQMTGYASGIALQKDFPQIEKRVYVTGQGMVLLKDGQASDPDSSWLADGNIFDILKVPFVRGDPRHALDDPHALVMSETEARKHFGDADPIGQTITVMSGDDLKQDYRITGVFKDIPRNSHFDVTVVARFDPQSYFRKYPDFLTSWDTQGGYVYVKLRPGADAKDIMAQMPAWERRNIPDRDGEAVRSNPGDHQDWRLTNVRDVHLGEAQAGAATTGSDRQTILTFALLALMILGIACINFTNLATARASQRAREVALRKVVGASRRQLIVQFVSESMLVAAVAMLIAMAIAELLLPPLNVLLGAQMQLRYLGLNGALLPMALLSALVGLTAGLYPAFYLSRFQPSRVLKANKSAADAEGPGVLRNLLVIGQFAVSIGLIVCTAVIYSQTVYARTMDAGYNRESLLQIYNIGAPPVEPGVKRLVEETRSLPGVTVVARTSIAVNPRNNSMTTVRLPGQATPMEFGVYAIDPDVIDALGMRLVAGRNFSETAALDDSTTPYPVDIEAEKALAARGTNVILSESAARRLGFATAQEAIGKSIQVGFTIPEAGGYVPATIVGVVSDVRYRSARQPLQPIIYYYQTRGYQQLLIRFAGDPKTLLSRTEAIWKRIAPEVPFEARFVTDIVDGLYGRDEVRARLFGMFAILAVTIASLGLFGLAAFTADRRTKEIGIRKVHGASTRDILRLLAWQFSKPVIVANLIAWPVAWWVMRDWLNGFDARISLGPTPFLAAGLLALALAVGTVAGHALRVARSNPINALRYE